jgi:hypothetical protein
MSDAPTMLGLVLVMLYGACMGAVAVGLIWWLT